jgi:NADH:ubiquinone oxidoreductase subunit E
MAAEHRKAMTTIVERLAEADRMEAAILAVINITQRDKGFASDAAIETLKEALEINQL